MSTRAAIYCRISDDSAGLGLGVARQEADCRALAAREGWTVTGVYVDNDTSAFSGKPRPEYLRLCDEIKNGHVDRVLAWHPDRLHRSPRELEDFIVLLEASGCHVVTVQAGLWDLSTPSGRMIARQLGVVARYESEHKRERNLRKARELAEAGKIGNGGPRPFGYQPDRLTLDPVEAALLQDAYADVLAGRALRSIVREWSERGITTSTGGTWSVQGLRFTLLRARNMGWREHHGRLAAPAVWEPVVEREVWEQAKAILTSPSRRTGTHSGWVHRYLLTGFLRCSGCGLPMKANRAGVQRFACRREPGHEPCPRPVHCRYDPAEALVTDLVLARLERDADLQPAAPADPTDRLREEIARQEARLTALADAFADEEGDVLELRRAGQRIRERIADLRRQIAEAGTARRMLDPIEVRAEWDRYDLAQRRAVLALLIERIDVAPAVRGRNRFDPDRLSVVWR